MTEAEVEAIRLSDRRDRVFGDETWARMAAGRPGRPDTLSETWVSVDSLRSHSSPME
jgi:hypothetical protein